MRWTPPEPPLSDEQANALWAESGARWLSDPSLGVPTRLVRRVVGLVDELDRKGADLARLVPARGVGLLAERAATMGLPTAGRTSCGGATRLLRCADGWVALSLARQDDLALLAAWLADDTGARGLGVAPDEVDGAPTDELWTRVERAIDGRRERELGQRAALLGLPFSVVGEVGDDEPVIASPLGDAASRPLAGAVVVSLASLWAGPLCADVLARCGARVITVESTRRPDGGRLAGRFFAALHGRSESVGLDLTDAAGREDLLRLLRAADVVIEGSRPRALEQMGIDAAAIVAAGPRIWLSITSHGRGPGGRDRVGFGDDTAAAGGLVGWHDDEPRLVADAVADPLTGLTAACAVSALLEAGGRWLVDASLARVAAAAAGGWVSRANDAPARRPRPRRDPGASMPLGRDTAAVFDSLGIRRVSRRA